MSKSYRFRLARFTKSTCVMDLRDPLETRKARAERYARRYKTCGKRAVYAIGEG